MAMDPFTFVGGAGLWSGIAGRSARAGTAAVAESLGVRVGNLTARETAEQIGKWGFSRFDDAARAELRTQLPGTAGRILDRGYHFKVPLTDKFFQIPGSAPVDWVMSRGAGRVRATLSDSPVGGWMRYATNPNRMRDAVTTMVTGRPTGNLTFGAAAEVINYRNGEKIASRTFLTQASRMADEVVKAAGGGHSGRTALNDLYRRAETQGGTSLHQFFTDVRKMAIDDFGIHVPEFEGPYLPHFWTDKGRDWLKNGGQDAQDFHAALYKEVDLAAPNAGVALQRKLVAGKTLDVGGGRQVTLQTGSADEINSIFRRFHPDADFDLIDTDFASVARRYIKSLEEPVGRLGGINKVLGSKSGLLHRMGDDTMLDKITDDEIRALAASGTADTLINQKRHADSVVKQVRQDSHRGVTDIQGPLGVELRGAIDELSTLTAGAKKELDDAVSEQIRLEAQRGVGKYREHLNLRDQTGAVRTTTVRPAPKVGKLEAVFNKAYNTLAKQHQVLEKRLGALKAGAVAEAKRIEASGGRGAHPINDEFQRVAAQMQAVGLDISAVDAARQRLEINQAAQGVINARLGDRDFVNTSVADNVSPKSPGQPTGVAVPSPVYTGASPLSVANDFNAKRANVLGLDDPEVVEVAARYDAQAKIVDHARTRQWQARTNHRQAVDAAHQSLLDAREYERGLKFGVEHTRGKPEQLERHLDLSGRLEAFQKGDLPRLQDDYRTAKQPIDDAERVFQTEQKRLAEIADEQMAQARALDARRADAPRPPLSRQQEATVRRQRRALVRDRNKWRRSPEGVAHTKAVQQLDTLTGRLEAASAQIDRATQGSGRFYLDADGALQTKFTTTERWATDLIEERKTTLIPARNAAEARYETATETWQRLSGQGVDVTSGEMKAAQREVSAAWKAWRATQEAVADANSRLAAVSDTPNLGRIGPEGDELRRLLTVQTSMKARVDELTQQVATSGQQLRNFEDGIAGINSQLDAQVRAQQLLAEGPVTPYTAQISSLHRSERQRVDSIEAQFPAPRDWGDTPELPARPVDLSRFEGQFENNPTIRAALDALNRPDGQVRTFDDLDEVTDLANSAAAIRMAAEPFTIPPKGTPAHTAVMNFSPASRGGAMGAVGRGQAVTSETQRVLDRHVPELIEAGAIPDAFGSEMFRQRLDLDRALDLHASNPSAHVRADLEAKTTELGRMTEFVLRYKQALEGGNEPSDGLAAFILARQLDDEAASLTRQISIGNGRLSNPSMGDGELGYSHRLAQLNERAVALSDRIEAEVAKSKAGQPFDERGVARWTREWDSVRRRVDGIGPPANGSLDDAVDSHAAYAADDMRSLDDAVAIYDERRFVDHRMQWPVRRKDQLAADIPHREGQVLAAKTTQKRLSDAVALAQQRGQSTVRYSPYDPEGFGGRSIVELPLAQAEANLANNERVIRMLEGDLVNKQVQSSILDGTIDERITLLEREIGDVDTPPNPPDLALENNTIRVTAEREQRALTPGELETIHSNRVRIERLNKGPLPAPTVQSMRDELAVLIKARDDFQRLMGGDAAHIAAARDNGAFIDDLVRSGRVISDVDDAMLRDIVGPETAAAAKVWIHHLDEAFAGQTAATADDLAGILDDAARTFGDNELVDRMRERAVASLTDDGLVSLDEMRNELSAALLASANRQRGESIREVTSMQALFGSSFVDGPNGMVPRFAAAASDAPSHQLLTARLRTQTLEAMQRKGYDPRNAVVDQVADLRTRLGRVETMRRGIDGNEEWMDVLLTGTPSAQTRRTLQAGREALEVEEQQLLGTLDAGRQARLAEQRKLLGDRTAAEQQPILTEMDRLQREADTLEREHTARLNELDMHLGKVRDRVGEARRDYHNFKALRDQVNRALTGKPGSPETTRAIIDDLKVVNEWRRDVGDFSEAEIANVEANLVAAAETTQVLDRAETTFDDISAALAKAEADKETVAAVTKRLAAEGWEVMAKGIIKDNPEGVLIASSLAKALENVVPVVQTNAFWRFVDKYTAFFKTYATSRPGFHVRNAISATFMNLVDGVRIRDMYEGARLWRQYENNPNFWRLPGTDPQVQDAFRAVFASGAGGQYIEQGLYGDLAAGSKMYRRVMDNALTRWNQRLGSKVEGSARLAMALNTTRRRGGTVEDAMRRVTKFHFDYTEMSDLDHMARRLIPFWTFMSRNLPLQLEQMLINPRMYLQYQSLVRNFGKPVDPMTPGYWLSAGAFTLDSHAADRESPWYIAPDLPHLDVTEPLDAMVRGEWDKALLSSGNPLFLAPLEAAALGHKVFSGASLEGYEETSSLNPFVPLFNLLGAVTPANPTATGGTSGDTLVDKRYAHIARSLLPPWAFAEQLLDPTGRRAGRTDETIYRALGFPVRQLTPELRETERNRAYYDRRDQHESQAELARM